MVELGALVLLLLHVYGVSREIRARRARLRERDAEQADALDEKELESEFEDLFDELEDAELERFDWFEPHPLRNLDSLTTEREPEWHMERWQAESNDGARWLRVIEDEAH